MPNAVAEARGNAQNEQRGLLGLIENLRATIRKLEWKPAGN